VDVSPAATQPHDELPEDQVAAVAEVPGPVDPKVPSVDHRRGERVRPVPGAALVDEQLDAEQTGRLQPRWKLRNATAYSWTLSM
jgi:hypothetical protein